MITIEQLITRIEQRQPVLNKAELGAEQYHLSLEGIGNLTSATDQQLSFLSNAHYLSSLASTQAAAVLVTALALIVDFLLSLVERWAVPKGLKVSR